jgi:ArsR family transcriptional regulator, arsenate/arsenite/antimonite-responsive transcriptional repressor
MSQLEKAVELLQAVADVNRLRMLKCLQVRSACVCEIVQATGIPQPRVSRHLGILRNAGLVRTSRDGQWVQCACVGDEASPQVKALLDFVVSWVEDSAEVALDRQRLNKATRQPQVTKQSASQEEGL